MQEKDMDEALENIHDHKTTEDDQGVKDQVESEIEDSADESDEVTYEELLEDRNSLKDRLLRALADSENLRKRKKVDQFTVTVDRTTSPIGIDQIIFGNHHCVIGR